MGISITGRVRKEQPFGLAIATLILLCIASPHIMAACCIATNAKAIRVIRVRL